jgi:hypothetical protein
VSPLLSAEADSLRDKGTKWQRHKVMPLFASLSALCLCAFASLSLCAYIVCAETKLKSVGSPAAPAQKMLLFLLLIGLAKVLDELVQEGPNIRTDRLCP